jgi:hypothetical protein
MNQSEWRAECVREALKSGRCVRTEVGNEDNYVLTGSIPLVGYWPVVRVDFRRGNPLDIALCEGVAWSDPFQHPSSNKYTAAYRRWITGGTCQCLWNTGRELASSYVNTAARYCEAL